jgi:ornithine cyclodeaminase/alanine dehydrogenase-like protein (mu-crystallin family)
MQIAGRDRGRAAALAEELTVAGIRAGAASSVEDAVRSADIVCATTHSSDPVVRRPWLRPGTHVNSVGYNTVGAGEVDADTVAAALVVVESRAAALAPPPSGAVELGGIGGDYAELGEVAAGTRPGRTDDQQITLYKSVGLAVQDAAAAGLILESARAQGVGTQLDF